MRSLIEDNSGGDSAMRVAFLAWMAFLIASFVKASWVGSAIPDIPGGVVAVTTALAASKAFQRFGEKAPT